MNDTPRVTVPVEAEGVSPVYTAAYDSIRKGAPGLSDATCAVIARSINMKVSLLSAAPAPEGGAVSIWSDARSLFVRYAELFAMTERYEEASALADKAAREIEALATREEAPAEAGEIGAEYDAAAHCVTLAECPPGLFLWNGTLGFKSEYRAMEPVDATNGKYWKVGNRADAYCADSGEYFWGGTSNHDDRAKLLVYPIAAEIVAMVASHGPSALRAQPPAREDAQPVAWRMIGRDGSTISLQGEPYHGGFAHMMASDVECTVEPLYTHPAPDALRVAVEALEPFARLELPKKPVGNAGAWSLLHSDIRRAKEALAALQAEQKGGA